MKGYIFLIFCVLYTFHAHAQSGPNGVGTNNIFWYAASDLSLSNGSKISLVQDKTVNNLDATQSTYSYRPTYSTSTLDQIENQPVMRFDGNDMLVIPSHNSINLGSGGYTRKSLNIVFKTGTDVQNTQFIYEEGGRINGLNLWIKNDQLYFGVYNNSVYDHYMSYPISASTNYIVTGVMSANHNSFKIYINGNYINSISLLNFNLNTHTGGIGLGGINGRSLYTGGEIEGANYGFKGSIAEFIYFNDSLSVEQVDDLTNYIGPDYGFTSDYEYLPIELFSFEANAHDSHTLLEWTTLSELNNDYFTLEYSDNGKDFEELAQIAGSGTCNTIRHYQFSDIKRNTRTYYRLRQTDYNGDYTYSHTIVVNIKEDAPIISFLQGHLQVQHTQSWTGGNLQLINMSGQVIQSHRIQEDQLSIRLNEDLLTKGYYLIRLQKGDQYHSQKVFL